MKNSLDGVCKILYFIYGMFLIYPIKTLTNMGLLNENIKIFNIIREIPEGEEMYYIIFQIIFMVVSYFCIKTSEKQLITVENEVCQETINENIFPYKLNIFVTIIFSMFIIYITGDKSLLLPSLLMLITSGLIFYARKLYYKACEIDKLSNLNTKDNINSTLWRFKVWHDKKERVEFKYRKVEIIVNILYILLNMIILRSSTIGFFELLFIYFILQNSFALLENIFNIFTSINGTCTGIYEHRTRSNRSYYKVVITDYTNKREVKVRIDSDSFISKGESLEVTHGVFSKQLVSINCVLYSRGNNSKLMFPIECIIIILLLK
ncbi:MAG TPA: hypothetical protein DDY58_05060 [Terrisporobacter glycolicus]|uniref:hypothetical protein n=1 Tax=Terrisporobacter TaxID=1505652 RepID=UPI000E85A9C3|nr:MULTISPECIES: hypothetical protein [Terrisporobacter]HBI91837.1 hypothetical protein [Terrisporobacter hibernicus]